MRTGPPPLLCSGQRNLQITISSIILKISTAGWDLSCRHREGGKGRAVISCCTVFVHFPDGLSSLLLDLVCVVLQSRGICVSSRTAVAPLHPFVHITQICVEFVTFAVLSSVSSLARSYGLVWRGVPCWPVRNTGVTWEFIRDLALFYSFAVLRSLSVCMWPCGQQYNYLSSYRCSFAAGAPASVTLHKKDNRPGDDISEILSVFTRTSRPLHLERKKRIRSLQMPSHHLSLGVHVESWWGEPLYAVMSCRRHLTEDRYML